MQADIKKEWVVLANRLADASGEILRPAFRGPVAVEHKADNSPVTEVDRKVEAALRKLIEAHCPNHGIIGEEYGNLREKALFQWVLDPIDGTRAFIAGQATFTTLIALAKDSIPILGIIDQPITGERWLGIVGERTTLNGKPVATRDCKTLAEATIATTSTDYFTPAQAQLFATLKGKCSNVTLGGDGYAYARLASGHTDMVIDASLKPYDFCALVPVIEGAGGIITDWDGKRLTIHSDGRVLAAANQKLHQQALKLLTP